MELYKLTEDIVYRISQGDYYCEITPEKLKDVIFEHLNDKYQKPIDEVFTFFEIQKMTTGENPSDDEYDREMARVKLKILNEIKEITRLN